MFMMATVKNVITKWNRKNFLKKRTETVLNATQSFYQKDLGIENVKNVCRKIIILSTQISLGIELILRSYYGNQEHIQPTI